MIGKILEWNLRFALFSFMFTKDFKIRRDFLEEPKRLKQRFFLLGICNLIFTPFTLAFRIIFFFLKNAEEARSARGQFFASREWTRLGN